MLTTLDLHNFEYIQLFISCVDLCGDMRSFSDFSGIFVSLSLKINFTLELLLLSPVG